MSYYRDPNDDSVFQALVGMRPSRRARSYVQQHADAIGELAGQAKRRKGEPCGDALPRTKAWVASLPEVARPVQLTLRFGRIANLLAAIWGDTDATYAYLDDLLVDRRGNRNGFPREVLHEIVALREHYANLHPRGAGAWVHYRRGR